MSEALVMSEAHLYKAITLDLNLNINLKILRGFIGKTLIKPLFNIYK